MELRKDAIYNVEIKTPAGVLVQLKEADFVTAHSACIAVQASCMDEKLLGMLEDNMRSFGFSGTYHAGYAVNISASLPRTETGEKQTCPRRMTELGPWDREEGLDTWELCGKDKCCSFCGSLHPDRVLELVREHGLGIIGSTDKGYKFYVRQPNVPNAGFGGIKYYTHHNTPEFSEAWKALVAELTPMEAAA